MDSNRDKVLPDVGETDVSSLCLFPAYVAQTAAVTYVPDDSQEGSGLGSGMGSTVGSLDGVQDDIHELVANRRSKGGPAQPGAQQTVENHVAMLNVQEESEYIVLWFKLN